MKYLLLLLLVACNTTEPEVVTKTKVVQDTLYIEMDEYEAKRDSLSYANELYALEVQALKDSIEIEVKKSEIRATTDTLYITDTVVKIDTVHTIHVDTLIDTVMSQTIATIYFDTTFYDTIVRN